MRGDGLAMGRVPAGRRLPPPRALPDRSPLLVGLALLLTVFSDFFPSEPSTALSTDITATLSPSVLQELASFAAMRDVAEEEDLDWGSSTGCVARAAAEPNPVAAGAAPATAAAEAQRVHPLAGVWRGVLMRHHRERLAAAAVVTTVDLPHPPPPSSSSDEAEAEAVGVAAPAQTRRPHRRQRRKPKQPPPPPRAGEADADDAVGGEDAECARLLQCGSSRSSSVCGTHTSTQGRTASPTPSQGTARSASSFAHPAVTPRVPAKSPLLSRLHVLDIAFSTQSNNFLHVTQRFVEYQRMYAVVGRVALSSIATTASDALDAAVVDHRALVDVLGEPQRGAASARRWKCAHCGFKHDHVRDHCVRCRHVRADVVKLFVGQLPRGLAAMPVPDDVASLPAAPLATAYRHDPYNTNGAGRVYLTAQPITTGKPWVSSSLPAWMDREETDGGCTSTSGSSAGTDAARAIANLPGTSSCAVDLLILLAVVLPGVRVLRCEEHSESVGGPQKSRSRGAAHGPHGRVAGAAGGCHGCASLYVSREDAALVIEALDGRAFVDVDRVTEERVAYVLPEPQSAAEAASGADLEEHLRQRDLQEKWIRHLADERVSSAAAGAMYHAPMNPLVVAFAAAPRAARRSAA